MRICDMARPRNGLSIFLSHKPKWSIQWKCGQTSQLLRITRLCVPSKDVANGRELKCQEKLWEGILMRSRRRKKFFKKPKKSGRYSAQRDQF